MTTDPTMSVGAVAADRWINVSWDDAAFLTLNVVCRDTAICLKSGPKRTCLAHVQNVADDPHTDCDRGEGAMPPLQCLLGLGSNSVIGGP